MGKAIIIPDISFALNNLGTITFIGQENNNQENLPQYNFLDILYTDGNGNLSVSSEVLASTEGKIPIGLCVAKTGFFGENEKARWIALQWANLNIGPNNGQYATLNMYFGPNTDIQEIDGVTKAYIGATGTNEDWGRFDWGNPNTGSAQQPVLVPNVYDSNGDWNLSELGTIGDYAITDIDGKAKTTIYLSYVTVENWQTSSITNNTNTGNWPAVMAAWHYGPNGTQQGDWYIGACGEYALMENLHTDVNTKLTLIHSEYSSCINSINNEIWTSTERDGGGNYRMNVSIGQFGSKSKNENKNVLPMLQY